MTEDARFEDGQDKPLNLGAMDVDDLQVISALAQDGVFTIGDMRWMPKERRFAILINRLRREDVDAAKRAGRPPERVRSLLVVDHVLGMASQGVDRSDSDTVMAVLSVNFTPGADADGQVEFVLAGDGALRANVEALEVSLKDVTRPYKAVSGHVPDHSE
ncbi:MAG: DUF2948 family protein [Pseudomonadota bacterium]|nr:DUF2948 family protein [Pseudomonadota bacterium]MEE3360287.1 DUF2948 family protein [Pseudomonadota bacterium]